MKFLLMFVLMLSIASVNADAQRRRSYSRSRTTQARKAPAKKTNTESEFYSTGYHRKTTESITNAAKYADNNLPQDEMLPYMFKAIWAEGNHAITALQFARRFKTKLGDFEYSSLKCTSRNGNTLRYKIHYLSGFEGLYLPVEMLTTVRSDGNEFITKVWYDYYHN